MKITSLGKTIKGNDHEENEDAILVDDDLKLYAVADGVSIPKGGKKAALKTTKYLKLFFKEDLKGLVERVNEKILEEMDKDPIGYTTVAVACVINNALQVANIGDSPVFLVRKDKINTLSSSDRLLETHSLLRAIGQENIEVHFNEVELLSGDYVILATDGITDVLDEKEITLATKELKTPEKIVNFLIKGAKERPKAYEDDKSIIVISVSK